MTQRKGYAIGQAVRYIGTSWLEGITGIISEVQIVRGSHIEDYERLTVVDIVYPANYAGDPTSQIDAPAMYWEHREVVPTQTDGCPDCGMVYSFYFKEQFHKSTCLQAAPANPVEEQCEAASRAAFEDAFLDDGEGPFLGN